MNKEAKAERERCAGIVMGQLNWTDDVKLKTAYANLFVAIINDPEEAMRRLNPDAGPPTNKQSGF